MKSLDIETTRDLENLCINTIYANLLTGKLSPHTQTFQITSCTSRDLSPTNHDYTGMIATLTQWSKQCDLVHAEISGKIFDIKQSAEDRKKEEDKYERDLENVRRSIAGKKHIKSTKNSTTTTSPSQVPLVDLDTELMQDVEEHVMISPRAGISGASGGESPGRKRKLVRPPSPSFFPFPSFHKFILKNELLMACFSRGLHETFF
jgi:COP9 signalosome complex subunit 7